MNIIVLLATLICYFNCYLYIFFLGAHMTKLVRALRQVRIHRHWKRKVPVPSRTLWQWFCGLAIRALSWVLSQDGGHWWKQKGDGRLDSWRSKLPWGSITLGHLFLFNMCFWPFSRKIPVKLYFYKHKTSKSETPRNMKFHLSADLFILLKMHTLQGLTHFSPGGQPLPSVLCLYWSSGY